MQMANQTEMRTRFTDIEAENETTISYTSTTESYKTTKQLSIDTSSTHPENDTLNKTTLSTESLASTVPSIIHEITTNIPIDTTRGQYSSEVTTPKVIEGTTVPLRTTDRIVPSEGPGTPTTFPPGTTPGIVTEQTTESTRTVPTNSYDNSSLSPQN